VTDPEPVVLVTFPEDDWYERLRSLPHAVLLLWMDLFPDAWRMGMHWMPLPPGVDPESLAALVAAGEVTLSADGRRYRHAGVDRARERSALARSKAGKASAAARRKRAGTAIPPNAPNAPNGVRPVRQRTERTERSQRSQRTEPDGDGVAGSPYGGAVSAGAPAALPDGAPVRSLAENGLPPPPGHDPRERLAMRNGRVEGIGAVTSGMGLLPADLPAKYGTTKATDG